MRSAWLAARQTLCGMAPPAISAAASLCNLSSADCCTQPRMQAPQLQPKCTFSRAFLPAFSTTRNHITLAHLLSTSIRRVQLRSKLSLTVRGEDDFKLPLLPLVKRWAGALVLLLLAVGIHHLDWAAVLQLHMILKNSAGRQRIDAEAGAGIIHFKQMDRAAGAVFNRHDNDIVLARSRHEQRQQEHGPGRLPANVSLHFPVPS